MEEILSPRPMFGVPCDLLWFQLYGVRILRCCRTSEVSAVWCAARLLCVGWEPRCREPDRPNLPRNGPSIGIAHGVVEGNLLEPEARSVCHPNTRRNRWCASTRSSCRLRFASGVFRSRASSQLPFRGKRERVLQHWVSRNSASGHWTV